MDRYLYGMKYRGFSIGCQPKDGFIERLDDKSGKYYDILAYNRPLTNDEISNYELDPISTKEYRITVTELVSHVFFINAETEQEAIKRYIEESSSGSLDWTNGTVHNSEITCVEEK